ncbi:hypothetical protein [uncultured Lacinutrix sp.]|uniref:hypothetical protein n=1 Tax=uncultured Lacinutrix sp. TaxID=574032 RepID=UPI002606EA86|nr:hypothetical protein [uncultured Lacinutrix sp.]
MNTIIIIITIIVGLILFSIVKNKIEDNRYKKALSLINQAHEKIGFPELDRETQMKMIINNDITPIKNLTPDINYKYRPTSVIDKYITIEKSDFKDYLHLNIYFLDKYKLENAPNSKHDGIWIAGNKIIDQERGLIHRTWNDLTEKDISNVYGDFMWDWMKQ